MNGLRLNLAMPPSWEPVVSAARHGCGTLRMLCDGHVWHDRFSRLLEQWGDAIVMSCSVRAVASPPAGERSHRIELLLDRAGVPWLMRVDVRRSDARSLRPRATKVRLVADAVHLIRDRRSAEGATPLSLDRVAQIYRRRHLEDLEAERQSASAWLKAQLAADHAATVAAYRQADRQPLSLAVATARHARPVLEPMLQVLPRCLDVPAADALDGCASLAQRGRDMGFEQVMIGGVEPQTTETYYGQAEGGLLMETLNDHGYWCTGQPGVDERLGGEAAYRALIRKLGELGMAPMQDVAPGSLGYPRQFSDGAGQTSDPAAPEPAPLRVYVDYTNEGSAAGKDGGDARLSIVSRNRFTSPYRLPKPDLADPATFEAVFRRLAWYIRAAGIARFRIDMAKHLPLEALRELILRLRAEVAAASLGSPDAFRALLEYWSGDYRDLASAMHAVADVGEGVYFLDFPLAYLIRSVLTRDAPLAPSVRALMRERSRFGVTSDWLLPFFIDHDFEFQPMYDGTSESSRQVATGIALAMALSTNGLCMYAAFDRATAGRGAASSSRRGRGHVRTRLSAKPSFDTHAPDRAAASLLALWRAWHEALSDCTAPVGIDGDDDRLTVLRSGVSCEGGMSWVRFSFGRDGTPAPAVSEGWTRTYGHEGRPSVVIDVRRSRRPGQAG